MKIFQESYNWPLHSKLISMNERLMPNILPSTLLQSTLLSELIQNWPQGKQVILTATRSFRGFRSGRNVVWKFLFCGVHITKAASSNFIFTLLYRTYWCSEWIFSSIQNGWWLDYNRAGILKSIKLEIRRYNLIMWQLCSL